MILAKNAIYLFDLDLVKIRLAIMISDFAEKKETFLTMTTEFFKVKKITLFFKAVKCFWPKMPNSSFFYIWSK